MPVSFDELTATVEPPKPAGAAAAAPKSGGTDAQQSLEQMTAKLRRQAWLDTRARAD